MSRERLSGRVDEVRENSCGRIFSIAEDARFFVEPDDLVVLKGARVCLRPCRRVGRHAGREIWSARVRVTRYR